MQNLSNYSTNGRNPVQRSPTVASIQNLQAYITDLTLYINENNHKYNKNMHILKQFYEGQVAELKAERNQISQEVVGMRNQVAAARDIIAGKNLRVRELEDELEQSRGEGEKLSQKLMSQRRKIDELYSDMEQLRKNSHEIIEKQAQKTAESREQSSSLSAINKKLEAEIQSLIQKVYRLQDQLSERYSLPQKIKDIQKENQKLKTALQINKRRLLEVQEKMDYSQAEIQNIRKQNETLRVMKGKFNAQKSLQIQRAVKLQREGWQQRIKKMQLQNQSMVYQLNEADSHLKLTKKEIQKLQVELVKQATTAKQFERDMHAIAQNKDAYIAQFSSLKNQYQGVIQRLQDSLIDYQKRNWNLEEENKQLNEQLEQLRELLQEVKAINSLQPAKKQYRKLAEMEIIASRPKQQPSPSPPKIQSSQPKEPPDGDFSRDWSKLLNQIDNIKA